MVKILSATAPYTDCSSLPLPRTLLVTSSDPECRVTVRASPDGTTPGPAVARGLSPSSTLPTWDASDFYTYEVTAGRDRTPTVAVQGPVSSNQAVRAP